MRYGVLLLYSNPGRYHLTSDMVQLITWKLSFQTITYLPIWINFSKITSDAEYNLQWRLIASILCLATAGVYSQSGTRARDQLEIRTKQRSNAKITVRFPYCMDRCWGRFWGSTTVEAGLANGAKTDKRGQFSQFVTDVDLYVSPTAGARMDDHNLVVTSFLAIL